jgi:hypothetical protein
LTDLNAQILVTPNEVLDKYYSETENFGESAIIADQCHHNTCIAATDAYLCLVEKQTYVKIIRKINTERYQRMSAFLKQIPFIRNWTHKEISFFMQQLQIREYAVPGSLVMEEA